MTRTEIREMVREEIEAVLAAGLGARRRREKPVTREAAGTDPAPFLGALEPQRIGARALYARYVAWTRTQAGAPVTENAFGRVASQCERVQRGRDTKGRFYVVLAREDA